jgi:hypothetical protein
MDKTTEAFLNKVAGQILGGEDPCKTGFVGTSTAGQYYVAFAANRPDLLYETTLVEALIKLDDDWIKTLMNGWRYGLPRDARYGKCLASGAHFEE